MISTRSPLPAYKRRKRWRRRFKAVVRRTSLNSFSVCLGPGIMASCRCSLDWPYPWARACTHDGLLRRCAELQLDYFMGDWKGASRAAHPTHHCEVGFGNAKIDMSEADHDGSTLSHCSAHRTLRRRPAPKACTSWVGWMWSSYLHRRGALACAQRIALTV